MEAMKTTDVRVPGGKPEVKSEVMEPAKPCDPSRKPCNPVLKL